MTVFWDTLFTILQDGEWHKVLDNQISDVAFEDLSSGQLQRVLWVLEEYDFAYVKTTYFMSRVISHVKATPTFQRFLLAINGENQVQTATGCPTVHSSKVDDEGEGLRAIEKEEEESQ